jgi:hypothetical protein
MGPNTSTDEDTGEIAAHLVTVSLTPADRAALTLFKWRYVLQGVGFTPAQARHLTFMRWLNARGTWDPE